VNEVQLCPRCHATEPGWQGRLDIDGRKCRVCGEWSSNTEISRGQPWSQDEIDQMLAGMVKA